MSLKEYCQPRPSAFAQDRRATVLSLDTFLEGRINGNEFFEENYFTQGMDTLVDRVFRHLGGSQSGSSVFQLSQAMGGGKTHSMIALGLLARDPQLRKRVLGDKDPAPMLGRCQVIGFNGRQTDARGGIWGILADQLKKGSEFSDYTTQLKAPGPEAWRQLLGSNPVIVFLDELPPYLEYATSVQVGNSDLSVVTTTALANLFVAVAEMENACVILSDLAGTTYRVGQERLVSAFDRAVQGISNEARRSAVPITPVNPNGDELYHILRKRLFERVATDAQIREVAKGYQKALEEAKKMDLTTTVPEALYRRVIDAYPFHPDFRELLGKFKENEGFQQTRGVIRLMQMLVSNLWTEQKADSLELVHPYDIDLNNDELASEIRSINPNLSEAIAHDVAHRGSSEVEEIDNTNGSTDASDSAKLILLASLSTAPNAIHGLRDQQLVDCLQRPGRNLSTFKANVMDKLATRAWYLHTSADGRHFFKNQQNLAAKLRSTALSLHNEVVDRMLKKRLDEEFTPTLRDCYQQVEILPPLDAVRLEVEKTTLVIVRPGGQSNQLPISSDWQDWWQQQEYKNRVMFLTGSRDTYQKLVDAARSARALESIGDELKSQNLDSSDPQWRALDGLKDRIGLQFISALKESFDLVVYPSINNALRSIAFELNFSGNQNGEALIRKTLEGVQKFTTKFDDDGFISRAEARLFGGTDSKTAPWNEIKRNAAVNTTWPFHKTSALEEVKGICVRKDRWRLEGNYVKRGPFPPPAPEVNIRDESLVEDGNGEAYLKIEALHADKLVFETGENDPTSASSPVPNPARFEAKGLHYRFMAVDSKDPNRVSPVRTWTANIRLKHQLRNLGDHSQIEFVALPAAAGVTIRYTTDGSSPVGAGAATYSGPFRVPEGCRVVLAVASVPVMSLSSSETRVNIPRKGETGPSLDPTRPTKYKKKMKLDESGAVWNFVGQLEKTPQVTIDKIQCVLESADSKQSVDFSRSNPMDGATLKGTLEKLQQIVEGGTLRLQYSVIQFPTGQGLLDWIKANNQTFEATAVEQ